MCNLEDMQIEGPEGDEEDAHTGGSDQGVFTLLIEACEDGLHGFTTADFHPCLLWMVVDGNCVCVRVGVMIVREELESDRRLLDDDEEEARRRRRGEGWTGCSGGLRDACWSLCCVWVSC